MSIPRLYIVTRDPRGLGGVGSMARFVYETAEGAGLNPCLVCNAIDREMDVRSTDVLRLDWRREIEHTTVDGMELKGIPRLLPEVEFLQSALNRRFWAAALADGDRFFCVAGASPTGLPLVLDDVSFGCWVATPFWEDRADRLESSSLLRRIRDRLSRPVMERIEQRVYEGADPVFVLSEYTAAVLTERYGIKRERFEVVPYPIDTDRFTPEGDTADADGPLILFVGRFNDPRKNTEMLVEAFSLVREEFPDATLRLIGDESSTALRSAFERHGVTEAVECLDYVPNEELPAHYRAADVFAIPSNQEGLAIVGLEAMACGTPVVSTRCGGPEGYVVDGETGYLVKRRDIEQMADHLSVVAGDSATRSQSGDRAQKVVEAEYAESVVTVRFEAAFSLS